MCVCVCMCAYSIWTYHYTLLASLHNTKTRLLRTDRSHEGPRNSTRETPLVTLDADHLKPWRPFTTHHQNRYTPPESLRTTKHAPYVQTEAMGAGGLGQGSWGAGGLGRGAGGLDQGSWRLRQGSWRLRSRELGGWRLRQGSWGLRSRELGGWRLRQGSWGVRSYP